MSACVTTEESPPPPHPSAADERLAERVRDALWAAPDLYAFHVDVESRDGVVRLSGYVFTPRELLTATRLAEGVSGVRRVVNDARVDQGYARPYR